MRESPTANAVTAFGPTAQERLHTFASLLSRWNPTIKLVSNSDIPHLWERHVDDALQLAQHIPLGTTEAVDLGSGGGFPGLILAIATDIHFHLIEADVRKSAFLQEAVATTRASATVHASRIEDVQLSPQRLVTARALAPLPRLLDLSFRFLTDDGICLFPKGERADIEITEVYEDWMMDLQQIPSRTSSAGRILRIGALRRRVARSS